MPGANGTNGTNGAPGATGPAGPPGATGPQGVAGAQGAGGMEYGEDAATFAGFTTQTFTGVAGGREVMHARCAAAFSGSHLCHLAEVYLASSATIAPASGAWVDASTGFDANPLTVSTLGARDMGRYVGSQAGCGNWSVAGTVTSPSRGQLVTRASWNYTDCTDARPLACCSTPYREQFRGFTSAKLTGARPGGRAEMHQACGAQYPGSHMCFHAEYQRATPTISPPAGGAWMDASGVVRGSGVDVDMTMAARIDGRYMQQGNWNCLGWTSTVDGQNQLSGFTITSSGWASAACTSALPVACCD